jgi:septal ring factor EnvC (AmiA/AmiB activator)
MNLKRTAFLFFFIAIASVMFGQDSLQLKCPLTSGTLKTIRASDKDYQKTSEYGVMITSKIDTLVQAVHDGAVALVEKSEDSKYDILIQYKSYSFWYVGVIDPKVKKRSKVKAGDIIAAYKPGDLLELLMFYSEEPVNPRKYLRCN